MADLLRLRVGARGVVHSRWGNGIMQSRVRCLSDVARCLVFACIVVSFSMCCVFLVYGSNIRLLVQNYIFFRFLGYKVIRFLGCEVIFEVIFEVIRSLRL